MIVFGLSDIVVFWGFVTFCFAARYYVVGLFCCWACVQTIRLVVSAVGIVMVVVGAVFFQLALSTSPK